MSTLPATVPADLDETARLVLLDTPDIDSITWRERVTAASDTEPTPAQLRVLWGRYVGNGDWYPPTHDIATGQEL
jgi:hypothetical protein